MDWDEGLGVGLLLEEIVVEENMMRLQGNRS